MSACLSGSAFVESIDHSQSIPERVRECQSWSVVLWENAHLDGGIAFHERRHVGYSLRYPYESDFQWRYYMNPLINGQSIWLCYSVRVKH